MRRAPRWSSGNWAPADPIKIARRTGDEDGLGIALHNSSRSYLLLERVDAGRDALLESLSIGRRLGYRELIAYCLGGLAQVAMLEGDAERAARFLGAAGRLFHEVEAAVDPEELETQEAIRKWATEALGADAFEAARAVGTETPVDELVPVAT